MRTTASYDLFPDAPSERAMARARWLAREGRVADAESAYRGVLASHPDLKPCWAEYFELLRRILREAGRYAAAEVAFEAAAQAAEHREQREEAEREILATRRYAFWAPRRPDDLQPAERWFADTGAVVLAPVPGPVPPSDEALAKAFAELAQYSGWHFGQVVAVGPNLPVWTPLAETLGAPLVGRDGGGVDPRAWPLVAALRPLASDAEWLAAVAAIAEAQAGPVVGPQHPAQAPRPRGGDGDRGPTDAGPRRAP